MCMEVSAEQAGRQAGGKNFRGFVLGESVTVSRRIKAFGQPGGHSSFFHRRKLLFSDAARKRL